MAGRKWWVMNADLPWCGVRAHVSCSAAAARLRQLAHDTLWPWPALHAVALACFARCGLSTSVHLPASRQAAVASQL